MNAAIESLCSAAVPGDTQRSLLVDSEFSDERYKHVLLPVWLVTYDYGAQSYQAVVNGATGQVSADRPWSPVKLALLVLSMLALLYAFYLFQQPG